MVRLAGNKVYMGPIMELTAGQLLNMLKMDSCKEANDEMSEMQTRKPG